MKNILVTGGAGFIGANFINRLLDKDEEANVINLDKLTYAGDTDRLKTLEGMGRYKFINGDICDKKVVHDAFSSGSSGPSK